MDSTGEDTPLLISGPPGLVPATGADRAPAEPAGAGSTPFITLPPGIALPPEVAESATHRIASARRPALERDEIVFLPAPIGTSPVPQAIALQAIPTAPVSIPTAAVSIPTAAAPSALATGAAGWSLALGATGEPVLMTGAAFLGRNPSATDGMADALLLAVDDPAKSVSKTHALLEVEAGALFLHDLDSTNGTYLRVSGADEIRVDPGLRVAVAAGSTVVLGDFPIRVTRPQGAPGT